FQPVIAFLEQMSGKTYGSKDIDTKAMRIIADHTRAAVMLLSDGILPSNKQQGYILRRLIRRALLFGRKLGLSQDWKYLGMFVEPIARVYEHAYPELVSQIGAIKLLMEEEGMRFGKTLEKGLREI